MAVSLPQHESFLIVMPWGRVGSNWFVYFLGTHGKAKMYNEPLTALRSTLSKRSVLPLPSSSGMPPIDVENEADIIRQQRAYLKERLASDAPSCGIKLSLASLSYEDDPDMTAKTDWLLAFLDQHPRCRIVCLRRRDLLKVAVSVLRRQQFVQETTRPAVRRRDLHDKPPLVPGPAMGPRPIDPALLLRTMRAAHAWDVQWMRFVQCVSRSRPVLTLDYQEVLDDPRRVLERSFAFLGLDATGCEQWLQDPGSFVKMTDDHVARSISNWQEVRQAVQQSEFSSYVEEAGN